MREIGRFFARLIEPVGKADKPFFWPEVLQQAAATLLAEQFQILYGEIFRRSLRSSLLLVDPTGYDPAASYQPDRRSPN